MNMSLQGIARALVMVLGMNWISPVLAAPREVRCESHSMRHGYCPTGAHGDVKLLRSHGIFSCTEGQTWGTDGNGIWVDRGCKGEFWVDDPSHHSHSGRNTAIAAGLIGAAVLAAVVASSKKGDAGEHESLPAWMIGTYHGYNPDLRIETTLDVGANGQIFARTTTQSAHGNYVGSNTVRWEDGTNSKVEQTSRGFRLISADNPNNAVEYYRGR